MCGAGAGEGRDQRDEAGLIGTLCSQVYKGLWRGNLVAIKYLVLPSNMSGADKHTSMAVIEAAISSSLSHPNIVQV